LSVAGFDETLAISSPSHARPYWFSGRQFSRMPWPDIIKIIGVGLAVAVIGAALFALGTYAEVALNARGSKRASTTRFSRTYCEPRTKHVHYADSIPAEPRAGCVCWSGESRS